jgi:hypothetical protein
MFSSALHSIALPTANSPTRPEARSGKLLKIGPLVIISVRRIRFATASASKDARHARLPKATLIVKEKGIKCAGVGSA